MKKRIFLFTISIALTGILFCTCKLSLEDTELLKKPVVSNSTTKYSINISISKLNDETKYIHIYRQDTSLEKPETVNIGVLYPEGFEASENSYIFTDELLYKNHTYKYKVRYCDNDGYHYTDWSNEIKVSETQSAFDDTVNFSYISNSTVYFWYHDEFYTLSLNGNLTAPTFEGAEDFSPMLIIETSTRTELFLLPSIEDTTTVNLRGGILPSNFLGTELKFKGIVGQKKIYANPDAEEGEDKIVKFIIWTPPTEIPLMNYSDKIIIPTLEGNTGIDYSRSAK